jgi:hypothetical protein
MLETPKNTTHKMWFCCNIFKRADDETAIALRAQRERNETLQKHALERTAAVQRSIQCIADLAAAHVCKQLLDAIADGELLIDVPKQINIYLPIGRFNDREILWKYSDDRTDDAKVVWDTVARAVKTMSSLKFTWFFLRDFGGSAPCVVFSKTIPLIDVGVGTGVANTERKSIWLNPIQVYLPRVCDLFSWKSKFFNTSAYIASHQNRTFFDNRWPRKYAFP